MADMNKKLHDLLVRAETWPEAAQEALAEVGLEIEAETGREIYHASPDELAAVDDADRSELASPEEIAAALAKLRRQ
ncbi:MAG TPA: hypothetical protein VG894_08300 [Bauldia sp.]|nr:hypothetical protein [Bauldia sp.]